jgi:hypothetical protein
MFLLGVCPCKISPDPPIPAAFVTDYGNCPILGIKNSF